MAKRKPARRTTAPRGAATSRKRTTTRAAGPAGRRATARTTKSSGGRKATRPAQPKASAAGPATRKPAAAGRKVAAASKRRPAKTGRATKPSTRTSEPRTRAGRKKTSAAGRRSAAPRTAKAARPSPKPARAARTLQRRDSPARRRQIERDRRLIEESLPTPPSTLDLDRRPSAARSGRAEMAEAFGEHTAAGPGITAGDVDADWASAYSTGDEAPGGDMPTPDQDVVEEIGTALGVQYADDEELKGADKIEQRDRHRWELDPASAEDYQDRSRQK